MRPLLLLGLALAAGCTEQPSPRSGDGPTNIFVGDLAAIGGQPVRGSQLQIRLYSRTGDFDTPDHYRIAGGCLDAGSLHDDGRFWSGSAPAVNPGMDLPDAATRGAARCPEEDPARYVQLLEVMNAGPKLEFDRASATFTAPDGASAKFDFHASMMID